MDVPALAGVVLGSALRMRGRAWVLRRDVLERPYTEGGGGYPS